MNDKVTSICWSEERNLPGPATVTAALEDALACHRERGTAVKCLVFTLDDTGPMYNTSYWNAGMKVSEIITLLEIYKARALATLDLGTL